MNETPTNAKASRERIEVAAHRSESRRGFNQRVVAGQEDVVLDANDVDLVIARETGQLGSGDGAIFSDGEEHSLGEFALECARLSVEALEEVGLLRGDRGAEVLRKYESRVGGSPDGLIEDFLEFLAREEGDGEAGEESGSLIERYGDRMLRSRHGRKLVRCPFLHLTRTPMVYREIPEVFHHCRARSAPVVQSHERDLITVASINPVTAWSVAESLAQLIEEESGKRPIASAVLATEEQWRQLNRKHFGS